MHSSRASDKDDDMPEALEVHKAGRRSARRHGLGLQEDEEPFAPYEFCPRDAFRCSAPIIWLDRFIILEIVGVWFMAFLILVPHEPPFNGGPLFHRNLILTTLWMWDNPGVTWTYYFAGFFTTFALAALVSRRYAVGLPDDPPALLSARLHTWTEGALWWFLRARIRWRVWMLVVGTGVFFGATIYSQVLLPNIDHTLPEWPTHLWVCHRWCGDPWRVCSTPTHSTTSPGAPAVNHTAAIEWYRDHVFGRPHGPVVATMLNDVTMRITVGPTSSGSFKLEADVDLSQPGSAHASFVVGEGGAFLLSESLGDASNGFTYAFVPQMFTWPSRFGDDACPNGGVHFEHFKEGACELGGALAVNAAVLIAIKDALHERFGHGISVSVFGFSRGGKATTWAVSSDMLRVGSKPFDTAYVHMGGTFGPGSVKLVDKCAEGFPAMVTRWPQWFGAEAQSLTHNTNAWPYDVFDYVIPGCHTTKYVFSVDPKIQWKNYAGCMYSIDRMRAAGCNVRVVEGESPVLSLRTIFHTLDVHGFGSRDD